MAALLRHLQSASSPSSRGAESIFELDKEQLLLAQDIVLRALKQRGITEKYGYRSSKARFNQEVFFKEAAARKQFQQFKKVGALISTQSESSVGGENFTNMQRTWLPNCGSVPLFLVDCAEVLAEQHVEEEGIFRKNCCQDALMSLLHEYEASQYPLEVLRKAPMTLVTGLVMRFLRVNSEPLIPERLYGYFIEAASLVNGEQARVDTLLLICLLLHPEQLSMLKFLLTLFHYISQHPKNKMSIYNLAMCAALNVFRDALPYHAELFIGILQLLINNWERVGELPTAQRDLMQQTLALRDFDAESTATFYLAQDQNQRCNSERRSSTKKRSNASREGARRSGSLSKLASGIRNAVGAAFRRRSRSVDCQFEKQLECSLDVESAVQGVSFVALCSNNDCSDTTAAAVPLTPQTPRIFSRCEQSRAGGQQAFSARRKAAVTALLPGGTPAFRLQTQRRRSSNRVLTSELCAIDLQSSLASPQLASPALTPRCQRPRNSGQAQPPIQNRLARCGNANKRRSSSPPPMLIKSPFFEAVIFQQELASCHASDALSVKRFSTDTMHCANLRNLQLALKYCPSHMARGSPSSCSLTPNSVMLGKAVCQMQLGNMDSFDGLSNSVCGIASPSRSLCV